MQAGNLFLSIHSSTLFMGLFFPKKQSWCSDILLKTLKKLSWSVPLNAEHRCCLIWTKHRREAEGNCNTTVLYNCKWLRCQHCSWKARVNGTVGRGRLITSASSTFTLNLGYFHSIKGDTQGPHIAERCVSLPASHKKSISLFPYHRHVEDIHRLLHSCPHWYWSKTQDILKLSRLLSCHAHTQAGVFGC